MIDTRCPFKRCNDQVTHCDGACHGLAPDGSPLTELPEVREDFVGTLPTCQTEQTE